MLLDCNKELISELKEVFSDSRARIVLQATQNYVDISECSSRPNYLYDMLDLEKLFENVIAQGKHSKEEFEFNKDAGMYQCKAGHLAIHKRKDNRNFFPVLLYR